MAHLKLAEVIDEGRHYFGTLHFKNPVHPNLISFYMAIDI
jgi:hypothetical protein